MLYDVFICHASEDKETFVRPLAKRLLENRVEVWYDEFSLNVGDSLRRSIDNGLRKSRFGIVVFSPHFFNKGWPQWELDGLLNRQLNEDNSLILPIWHEVSTKDVLAFSPSFADKVAIKSNRGLDHVVDRLLKRIRPDGSTLIVARDILLDLGYTPPVITDDWWLDVVEFSAFNDLEGGFQEAMGWGRWGFPLPYKSTEPHERGERLACAAMQMMWQEKAANGLISQITHPNEVLEFISSTSGLTETCHEFPQYLAAYAPQLTIKGFGGVFEQDFESWYVKSKHVQEKAPRTKDNYGLSTSCDEALALRDPEFCEFDSVAIACNFVQGELFGPSVKLFETIDYIAWFLSKNSSWMPKNVHGFLIDGLINRAVWQWTEHDRSDSGFKPNTSTGALSDALFKAKSYKTFKLTKRCVRDLETRFTHSIQLLGLDEDQKVLAEHFINTGFIEGWFNSRRQTK